MEIRIKGILMAITLEVPLYGNWSGRGPGLPASDSLRQFWKMKSEENASSLRDEIIDFARRSHDLRRIALEQKIITLDDSLRMPDAMTPLLRTQPGNIYGLHWGPILLNNFSLSRMDGMQSTIMNAFPSSQPSEST